MSCIGIGKHKPSHVRGTGGYAIEQAFCPYCGYDKCEADHVDVGVGMVQCGPYFCPKCEASEASYYDKDYLTEEELETGWFAPGKPVSPYANTIDGCLVDHKTAKELYRLDMLDRKPDM